MKRTTVMLPSDLRERAFKRSRETGISFGELLRECLTQYLAGSKASARRGDPFFADAAVFKGKVPRDTSEKHDRYLYGD